MKNTWFKQLVTILFFGLPLDGAMAQGDLILLREEVKMGYLEEGVADKEVTALVESLHSDGYWPGLNYEDVSRIAFENRVHIQNIGLMSTSFAHQGSSLYQDLELKQAIEKAVDFWLEHDFIADNWHTNEIANPMAWLAILYKMDGELTQEQEQGIVGLAKRGNLQAWGARPGGDLIKIAGIVAELALYLKDEKALKVAVDAMVDEVKITSGMGIKPDLSFHHRADRVTSILAYGTGYAATFANWAERLAGTEFQFPDTATELLVDYYLDGICKSMVHASYKDPGSINRGMAREGSLKPISPEIPEKLLAISDYRKDELERVIKTRKGEQQPDFRSNRFFWFSEYASHQRPDYFTSVRMYSERNHNMESPHNQESLMMHHYADGSNFISKTGKEYYDIFPVWDWQKIPGTTIVQKQEPYHGSGIVKKGKTDFVGAVSDGEYGAAAFDFESPHDQLKARKAWFFFDEEYMCLGSGITSEDPYPVVTTLNQTLINGEILTSNQEVRSTLDRGEHELENVSWVLHDGVGYFFPGGENVSIKNKDETGAWQNIVGSQRVQDKPSVIKALFGLWIDHGVQPINRKYEYMIIPNATEQQLEVLAENSPIIILSNTHQLQAVWHQNLNRAQAVFYEAGTLQLPNGIAISAKQPGMVMVATKGKAILNITIADPTRKLKYFELASNVTLDGHGPSWNTKKEKGQFESKLQVMLPKGDQAGKSMVIKNHNKEGEIPDLQRQLAVEKKTFGHPDESNGKRFLGEHFGGGIVIWLDESAEHGLIAAMEDQSTSVSWKNGAAKTPQLYGDHGSRLVNAVGGGIYAGISNTATIIAQQTADDIYGNFAARECAACQEGGYGDWYLPAKDELDILFQYKEDIGGFEGDLYWSSTEYNIGFVWGQNFSGYGGQFTQNKGSGYAVRCIRKF